MNRFFSNFIFYFKNKFSDERWLLGWKPFALLFALIFIIYGQSIFFGLTYLDDNTLIIDRSEVISDLRTIKTVFSSDAFFSENRIYYRPMLNLAFMLDAQFGVFNMPAYHISNLLWHYLAVILFFILLKRLSRRPLFSFLASAIFAIHPAISQAVVWLPGRNDSLVAVFVLATFLSFLNYYRSEKLKWLILYSFFFFLSLLSKETSLFLPILSFVYLFSLGREKVLSKKQIIFLIALPATVAVFWFTLRHFALGSNQVGISAALASVFANLIPSIPMGAKMFLPFNLSVLPIAVDTSFFWSLIAWPAFIFACFKFKINNFKALIFGAAWFAIFFFPPFIISSGAPFLLEHRLYLPLMGLLIALSSFADLRDISWRDKKVKIIFISILIIFSAISFFHSRKFSDPLTFWQSAVSSSPNSPLARKNLGAMYYFAGNYQASEREYNMALKINPEEVMVNSNLGLIYMNRSEFWRAESAFLRELKVNPNYDKAFTNLSELYFKLGNYKLAKVYAMEASRVNPNLDLSAALSVIDEALNKESNSLQ